MNDSSERQRISGTNLATFQLKMSEKSVLMQSNTIASKVLNWIRLASFEIKQLEALLECTQATISGG